MTSTNATVVPFKITQSTVGHFGLLTHCVLIAKACLENDVEPYFFIASDLWQRKGLAQNAFTYYYAHRRLSKAQMSEADADVIQNRCVIIKNRYSINRYWRGDKHQEVMNELRTLSEGRKLFERYIVIRPAMKRIAEAFESNHFAEKPVLGLHFRGKDKQRDETDPIEFERIYQVVKANMARGYKRIFLATDERDFFDWMMSTELWPFIVCRSKPSTQLPHYLDVTDNFRKGADALIDALLLARCDLVVKTPSLLSAWSKVFNPNLKLALVGRPYNAAYGETTLNGYGYWPERCFYEPLGNDSKD
jgi:hypothetical protein